MDHLWTPWRYAYVTRLPTSPGPTGVSPASMDASQASTDASQASTDASQASMDASQASMDASQASTDASQASNRSNAAEAADLAATSQAEPQTPKPVRRGVPEALAAWPGDCDCVFCNMIAAVDFAIASGMAPEDAEGAAWILERGPSCFLVLNAFPYNSGHLMAVPYLHESSLAALPLGVADELLRLTRRAERVLRAVYRPDGLNLGLNLGEAAGAGVAGHLHLHAVPRWSGDTNYMSVLAETRVLPETLGDSWRRIRAALAVDSEELAAGAAEPVVEPVSR
jgi:ATP adenylyltransferase